MLLFLMYMGKKFSEEHRRKLSVAKKGKKLSDEHRRNIGIASTGRVFSYETRKKISLEKSGSKNPFYGKKHSEETKKKMSIALSGNKNHKWIEDKSKLQKYGNDNQDRRSSAYRYWRQQVWLRDNFACKIANPDCEGRIEAHHILGYTEHPELRYEINNGITLCHAHHPRKRAEEKRLSPYFQDLVSVSKETF